MCRHLAVHDARWASPRASIVLALLIACAPAAATVRINEVMTSNGATLADEDGDFEDWVELVNIGGEPVSLDGYGLSDRDDQPFRWVFPAVTLPPGKFLLVWASGKDRDNPAAPLHTNFSIAAAGEPITLSRPDGSVSDRLDAAPIPRDVSLGRQPDGSGPWYFFESPTPGAPNTGEGSLGVLDPPVFSHEGGFYTAAFSLTVSATAGAVYYSLDGSQPDSANLAGATYAYKQQYPHRTSDPFGDFHFASYRTQAYGGPIAIHDRSLAPDSLTQRSTTYDASPARYIPLEPVFKGTVVRARAEAPGYVPSETITHTYFVTESGRSRYGLPVLALTIQEDDLYDYERGIHTAGIDFDQWRIENPSDPYTGGHRPANYTRRGREAEVPAVLEVFGAGSHAELRQGIGIRIHGASTRSHPQKTLRVYARRDYDERTALAYAFFPGLRDRHAGGLITEFDTLLLRTSGNDSARDPQSYQALTATRIRDAFQQRLIAPLGLDGQAYEPAIHFINGEYWGLINLRERIDDHMLARRHGIDRDDIVLLTGEGIVQAGHEEDRAEWLALRAYVDDNDMADPAHYAFVANQIDLENFLHYQVALIYLGSVDWPGNNIDYWRARVPDRSPGAPPTHDGRWRWIVYDLDHAFQLPHHQTLRVATEAGRDSYPNPDWSTVLLRNLLENPGFRLRFINTMADLINSSFTPRHVHAVIDEMYARIAPYLIEHAQRWPHTGDTSPMIFRNAASIRPNVVRQHLVHHFGLAGHIPITIEADERRGRVRLNSLTLDETLPGIGTEAIYPWTGEYFLGVPILLEAIPEEGYRFAGWAGLDALEPKAEVTPSGPMTIRAVFQPVDRDLGDVNGDGVINAVDVQLVINGALGIALDPTHEPDVNGDGMVNAVDVQLVINAALGVS